MVSMYLPVDHFKGIDADHSRSWHFHHQSVPHGQWLASTSRMLSRKGIPKSPSPLEAPLSQSSNICKFKRWQDCLLKVIISVILSRSSGTSTIPTLGSIGCKGWLRLCSGLCNCVKRVDLPTFGRPTIHLLLMCLHFLTHFLRFKFQSTHYNIIQKTSDEKEILNYY